MRLAADAHRVASRCDARLPFCRSQALSSSRDVRARPPSVAVRRRRFLSARARRLEVSSLAGRSLRAVREPAGTRRSGAHADRRMAVRRRSSGGALVNPLAALLVVVGYLLGSLSFAVIARSLEDGKGHPYRGVGQRRRDQCPARIRQGPRGAGRGRPTSAKAPPRCSSFGSSRPIRDTPRRRESRRWSATSSRSSTVFGEGRASRRPSAPFSRSRPAGDAGRPRDFLSRSHHHSLRVAGLLRDGGPSPAAGGLFHAPRAVLAAAAIVAVLIVLKHRENLERLARGEERKMGRQKQ